VTAIEIDGRGTMNAAMAHFVAYHPKCGTLHGHNVSLSVRIEVTQLDPMGFVVDFSSVKSTMRGLLAFIDHKGLVVPAELVGFYKIMFGVQYFDIRNGEKHYFLPDTDFVVVPVTATTAEELAKWAATRIWEKMPIEDQGRINRMEVTFWETPNTGATFVMHRTLEGMNP
jgi:6-pyruvoyltetrahydropterin/6-carboxytetrahydropterin synthase